MVESATQTEWRGPEPYLDDITAIADQSSLDGSWNALERFCAGLGFDYSGVGLLEELGDRRSVQLSHATGLFARSFAAYSEKGLQKVDPSVAIMVRGASCTTLHDAVARARGPLRQGGEKVLAHVRGSGIEQHFCMRVDLAEAPGVGFLALGVTKPDKASSFSRTVAARKQALRLGAMVFSTTALRLRRDDARSLLSRRERRVLSLAASGFSARDIAEEDNRSVATIRQQLMSARRRLGARNTAQAVSVAQNLGLISLK